MRSLVAPLVAFLLLLAVPATAAAEPIVGLTIGNRIVAFDSTTPGTIDHDVAITGLQPGEHMVGLDFRPATGDLYGVGSSERLYRIRPESGQATPIGPQFVPGLNGTEFGVDFNPTADRLRVVSDTEQNLRVNPETGAVIADPNLNQPRAITGAAYTNTFPGTTATTLFDIDAANDDLVRQDLPNLLVPIGPLGTETIELVGFDIARDGAAYASLTAPGAPHSQLYGVNLTTGQVGLIGAIGGSLILRDIAVGVPSSLPLYFVSAGRLMETDPTNPPSASLIDHGPISGVTGTIRGLDFRPATGELYTLGVNAGSAQLYVVNPQTAAATARGGSFAVDAAAVDFGVDFNPTNDQLRVVNDRDQNFAVDPVTGVATAQTALNPAGVNAIAAAYRNNEAGAATTTLYDIDNQANPNALSVQAPPASGTLTQQQTFTGIGAASLAGAGLDVLPQTGAAFANLAVPMPTLYPVAVTAGGAQTLINLGTFGVPAAEGLAAGLTGTARFTHFGASVHENGGTITLTVRRLAATAGPFSVDYATRDGSALAGRDYTARSGTITFPHQGTEQTIAIPIHDDGVVNGSREFFVDLGAPSASGTTSAPDTAGVRIADDDHPPHVPPHVPAAPLEPVTVINAALRCDRPRSVTLNPARALGRGFNLQVQCTVAGTATVQVAVNRRVARQLGLSRLATTAQRSRRTVVVARGRGRLVAGRHSAVRVRFTRRARRALRRRARISLQVRTTIVDAGGARETETSRATLRRRR